MKECRNTYMDKKSRKREAQRKKRVRRIKKLLRGVAVLVLLLLLYLIVTLSILIGQGIEEQLVKNQENVVTQETGGTAPQDEIQGYDSEQNDDEKARQKIRSFAQANNLTLQDYPEELIESFAANLEKEEFVLNYPLKKDTYSKKKLSECIGKSNMPLLLQWDERWGYYPYGKGVIGVLGCGPTSLSMVALHLLQDSKLTPIYMADYAMQNGYYAEGEGTAWDLMTEGAQRLGLKVQEVPLVENVVMRHLQQGRPIICAMGPGDFTRVGHFIVLVGTEDGKIRINDCNSKSRSEKLWEFDDFKDQIKNMWAYNEGG